MTAATGVQVAEREVEVRFGAARVRVVGADAALVASLRLNLAPVAPVVEVAAGEVGEVAPAVTVEVVHDAHAGAALDVDGAGWQEGLLKVDPDHPAGEVTLRRVHADGLSIVLTGSGTRIEVTATRLTVVGCGDEVFRRDVHRVIRNWYVEFLLAQGYVALHAAAARVGDTLVVLCGEKGRGKTTLLLDLLRRGATFVTNDLLLIRPHPDGSADYHLVPEAVFLGRGTLQALGWEHLAPDVAAAARALDGPRQRLLLRCRDFFDGLPFVRIDGQNTARRIVLFSPEVLGRGPARRLGTAEVERLLCTNHMLAHDAHAFAWLNVRGWDIEAMTRCPDAALVAALTVLPVWSGPDSRTLWTMLRHA